MPPKPSPDSYREVAMIIEARRNSHCVGPILSELQFIQNSAPETRSIAVEATMKAILAWKFTGSPFSAYARRVAKYALIDKVKGEIKRSSIARFVRLDAHHPPGRKDEYFQLDEDQLLGLEASPRTKFLRTALSDSDFAPYNPSIIKHSCKAS